MTRNPNLDHYSKSNASHQAFSYPSLRLDTPKQAWWTGKPPIHTICPGVNEEGIIHSLPLPNLQHLTRASVQDYFDNTWTLTEVLFSALSEEEAFYRPPYHQLRHPLIFYYCHPAVFYINKLRLAKLIDGPLHKDFEKYFETGVDEMSWDDLSKNELTWPKLAEMTDYRADVYSTVTEVIQTHPDLGQSPLSYEHPLWALFMGFEHERIHLETSSVLMRELPLSLISKPKAWPHYYPLRQETKHSKIQNPFILVDKGKVHFGKPRNWPSFGWDNEYGEKIEDVAAFEASQSLISNAEFWEFVASGGYFEPRYWTQEGWQWRQFRNAKWPSFWVPSGPEGLHEYQLRLCFDIAPMQWTWPVEVNYYEAKAYCVWKAESDHRRSPYRLITEKEHHRLRSIYHASENDFAMKFNSDEMKQNHINTNLAFGSPSPVNFSQKTTSGFCDVVGNLWEWSEDCFSPLPHFKTDPLFPDFSLPCFDKDHHLILGGAFISTGDEASIWARFSFRRHFFQHIGFRLVRDQNTESQTNLHATQENVYETKESLNQYLLLHYGDYQETTDFPFLSEEVVHFPKRCAQLLCQFAKHHDLSSQKALDLGCAVGGSSFELAKLFSEVVGIDISHSFINTANFIKRQGKISYSRIEEGHLQSDLTAMIDPHIHRERISFIQGDACNLPSSLGQFNAILMANLLCRLPHPKNCLQTLEKLLPSGGLLLNASPYSWLSRYTSPTEWLGGTEENGVTKLSAEGLSHILSEKFELIFETNLPFIIREHARKYEYIISHTTLWRRH